MAKSNSDEKILSYNDVVLRRSDLDILNGPYYLNDRVIEFYFSYLSSLFPSDDLLLVPPSIAFWIKECPDPASLRDFMEPLHLSRRKLILLPINDNSDVSVAEGGSHWSLLAFDRNSNVFVHHDSSFGCLNEYHSKQVYKVTLPYTASNATYRECPNTPKQVNGYDCGMYVLAIARVICQWYVSRGTQDVDTLWFSHLEQKFPLGNFVFTMFHYPPRLVVPVSLLFPIFHHPLLIKILLCLLRSSPRRLCSVVKHADRSCN